MAYKDDKQPTRVLTGKVRISYPHVFKAQAAEEGGEPKYSVSLVIRKTDKATLADVRKAIDAAKKDGLTSKWGGKMPPARTFKEPLRDGDDEKAGDPMYAGCFFINASSKDKPTVLDQNREPITTADEFYAGCFGRAAINFFPYTGKSNGVGCGLNNLQKLSDGPRVGGKSNADDDFADDFEGDDNWEDVTVEGAFADDYDPMLD